MKNGFNHLVATAGAALLTLPVSGQSAVAQRLNFVFILLDDLAYDALESSGRYPFLSTPNITKLQQRGVTFDNYFCTMSLSSPSRACFLTGVYPHLHGATQNDHRVDPDWQRYQPYTQLLQQAGYQSAFVGKMHNAHLRGKEQVRPGFDYWLGFVGQGDYHDLVLNENGREFQARGYITDLLTDYAERWITTRRNPEQPFSLCLWHKAVHEPFVAAPRHLDKYKKESLPLPPRGNGVTSFDGKPEWQREKKRHYRIWERDPEWNPSFTLPLKVMETLLAVDESVGRVVRLLEQTGLIDNTVIVFSSDNGYFMGEHGFWDKRIAYDECMRIPMIIACPKLFSQGRQVEELCTNVDLAPTILQLAGVKIPSYMQGRSMLPLLRDEKTEWRDAVLFEYFVDDAYSYAGPTHLALRTKRYKLVDCNLDNDIDELYDLENDPGEMRNLINDPSALSLVLRMRSELERVKRELKYNPDRDFHLRKVAPEFERRYSRLQGGRH